MHRVLGLARKVYIGVQKEMIELRHAIIHRKPPHYLHTRREPATWIFIQPKRLGNDQKSFWRVVDSQGPSGERIGVSEERYGLIVRRIAVEKSSFVAQFVGDVTQLVQSLGTARTAPWSNANDSHVF